MKAGFGWGSFGSNAGPWVFGLGLALGVCLPSVRAQAPQTPEPKTVQELVQMAKKAQKTLRGYDLRAEILLRMPIPGRKKMEETKGKARIRLDQAPDGKERSRVLSQLITPLGTMSVDTLRNAKGVFIHQASENRGEQWYKIGPELVAKLDRAKKVLGKDQGAPGGGGISNFFRIDFLQALARTHDLSLKSKIDLMGVSCWVVHASPKGSATKNERPILPTAASEMDLYFDAKTFILRKMIQTLHGKDIFTLTVRTFVPNPKFDPKTFASSSMGKGKFQDIMEDPIASATIRSTLDRL
ncbi:MAG TPA: hypothetical protein ENK02_14405, partial [Planctomycetes bacterium]|nr:hypothetical protein [Planctomycetota bacterium]